VTSEIGRCPTAGSGGCDIEDTLAAPVRGGVAGRPRRKGLADLLACDAAATEPLEYLMVFALAVLPMVRAIWLFWHVLLYSHLFDAFIVDSPFL